MKKGNWKVSMGFATGSPRGKNASWFTVIESHSDCTLRDAIHKTMNSAYSISDDICANWIFWCEDDKGSLVLPIEQAQAELSLIKKFVREVGE